MMGQRFEFCVVKERVMSLLRKSAFGGALFIASAAGALAADVRWSRLSEQILRVDKWSVCRG